MTPTTELAKEAETSFEYLGITDPKQKAALADATKSLRNRIERATQNIIEIGKRLTEVKKMLGHGKFLAWIEKEFGMSERTARNFMAVSLKFKSANFADFQPSALYLLASPFTPDEAREEAVELASKGEKITHKKAKEIKEKHAPKKEVTPRERKEPEAPATDPEAEPQETIGAFKAEYEFSELPAGYGKQTYPENEYGDLMRWLRDQMVRVLNQANLQQRRIDMTDAALVRLFVTVGEDYFEVQTALASMRKRR